MAERCMAGPILACAALAACGTTPTDDGPGPGPGPDLSLTCAATAAIFDGGAGRGGIPALTNPPLVELDDPGATYVDEYAAAAANDDGSVEARVVGLYVDGTAIAVPHNVLWWHEIVNLDVGGHRLSVTYCPLTGSPLVFDLGASGVAHLGVSGLIFENNLVMFDPDTESLWPQLCLGAVRGPLEGSNLIQFPATDMRWETWKARHPDGLVVSSATGFDREYTRYPYRFYEASDFLLFPLSRAPDTRRPLKERVFGIGEGRGGIAFPFEELVGTSSGTNVITTLFGGGEVILLWDGEALGAGAFYPRTMANEPVKLRASEDGRFTDAETGTQWNAAGLAIEGPMAGSRLQPVAGAFVAYWFAWAAFYPDTGIWLRE